METLPYLLVAGIVIGFLVLLFGLNTFGKVYTLTNSQEINSQFNQMKNKIDLLESMSYGSFDYIYLTPNSRLTIFENGTAIYNGKSYYLGTAFSCIRADNSHCSNQITLYPGKYKFVLYRGDTYGSKYCFCFT